MITLGGGFVQEYGVSVQLYRTPYLVDIIRESVGRVLTLDSIMAGDAWKDMDMLIFNSWHWWIHKGQSQGYAFIAIIIILLIAQHYSYTPMDMFVPKQLLITNLWVKLTHLTV